MQCKRRHCYTRVSGILLLLVFCLLFAAYKDPTRAKRDDARTPSPTRTLVNVTLGSAPEPLPAQEPRNPLGSNGSLSREIDSEGVRKVEPYTYIINQPEKCHRDKLFLVLLVTSEPYNHKARDAIRQTWGNESLVEEAGLVRLFLLGMAHSLGSELQRSIQEESRKYRDIVQQDYIDSYYNLTTKTLMGMHWVATFCPNASYVMKTDSDMFVNTEYLVWSILDPKVPKRDKYFTGYLMRGFKPNRDKSSKWYMSPDLYASDTYPSFCSGTGYVFSADMAGRIYNASLSIRRLHLEDVYVGICLAKLGIEPEPPAKDSIFHHWKVSYSSCRYSQLVTSHQFSPAEMINHWQYLQTHKRNPCGRRSRRR